ncbi:hypothetical protein B1218_38410, partial [Pseudomonas ogarae]
MRERQGAGVVGGGTGREKRVGDLESGNGGGGGVLGRALQGVFQQEELARRAQGREGGRAVEE